MLLKNCGQTPNLFNLNDDTFRLEEIISEESTASSDGGSPSNPFANFSILDSSPEKMERPLAVINNRAYAASWVSVRENGEISERLVVVRDDGRLIIDPVEFRV